MIDKKNLLSSSEFAIKHELYVESEEFNTLIERCKNQDPDALEKFFNIYSIEIYNFPIKVFHFSEEDAGDFFLFAFERLRDGKRFKSFRGESTFRTWFYSVLRNLVLDWLRSNKKNQEIQFLSYSNLNILENEIPETLKYSQNHEMNITIDIFNQILQNIEKELKVIFKLIYLFYLNLDEDDINYLREKYHKTPYEILKFVIETKDYLTEKNLRLIQKYDHLQNIYLKLLKLQRKEYELASSTTIQSNVEKTLELDEIQKKIQTKNFNRNKILRQLNPNSLVIKTPIKKISTFLGISTPTVSSLLKKAESYIKNSEEIKKIFTK